MAAFNTTFSDKKVIIIGGGLAGLAAANKLYKENFNVILLEGDNRLGGRIKTAEFSDGTDVALGCMYFHGTIGNSLYEYYSTLTDTCHKEYPAEDVLLKCLYSDGTCIPLCVSEDIKECLEECLEPSAIASSPNYSSCQSIYDYLSDTFFPRLQDIVIKYELSNFDLFSLYEGFLSYHSVSEGSKYLQNVKASSYANWQYLEGDECLFVTGNPFQHIIDDLSNSLPPHIIKLGSKVTRIDWSEAEVVVSVNDSHTYTAPHVLVTVSLGVLKQFVVNKKFNPPLPIYKRNAIKQLGYGLVNKIILQFDGQLYENKYFTIQLHWTPQDRESQLIKDNPWLTGLHQIDCLPTSSNCYFYYVAWLCDEDALAIEQIPKSVLKEVLYNVFKKSVGSDCPHLLDIKVSHWSNEFSCGSYSYTPVQCHDTLRDELCQSIDNKLYFAGEATSNEQYSTAHAAYDTGLREAQNIINYYNVKK